MKKYRNFISEIYKIDCSIWKYLSNPKSQISQNLHKITNKVPFTSL